MATQSRAPTVLLTRPAAQSARFAADLRASHAGITTVISPLLVPELLTPDLPPRDWSALILTSQTALRAVQEMAAKGASLPATAFCVGPETARAARAAGLTALSADGDAAALIALIRREAPSGPLLHLHGRETLGDIAATLTSAGLETFSAIAYAQNLHPLTPEAETLLTGPDPVLAPVFSPRSALALAQECARIHATAPLTCVAISPAAAAPLPAARSLIAARPDGKAMLTAVLQALNSPPPA